MKRKGTIWKRLLPAGLSLALLAGLAPGALAAGTTLRYRVDSDEVLEIPDDQLNDYCKDRTGYGVSSIWFTDLPSAHEGMLTYADSTDRQYNIREGSAISYSSLYYLVFTPDEDFDGTLTIPFEGQSDNGLYYDGQLEIEVYSDNETVAGGVMDRYTIQVDQVLRLSSDDFDNFVFDTTDHGYAVDYIRFTALPAAGVGVLYETYGTWYQKEAEANKDYTADQIDQMTFVPASGYQGTVTLPFTGRADSGERFSASLVVTVGSSGAVSGDVTYDTGVNTTVVLSGRDFDAYVREEMGDGLSLIWFSALPTANKGVFYFDFNGLTGDAVNRDAMYSYSELSRISFVPAGNYQGAVSVPFEGVTVNGKSFSGELVIRVGSAGYDTVTISLKSGVGGALAFRAADFNAACKEETGFDLDYVVFDYASGTGGYLYSQYDQEGQSLVGSEKYYRSGTPGLDQVTFVPGAATGSAVTIPFTGRTVEGSFFRGQVELSFTALTTPDDIQYTSDGTAIHFSAVDFVTACAGRGGQMLKTVRFLTPDVTGGKLCYGFRSPAQYQGAVSTALEYGLSGSWQLNEVAFLPEAGYSGLVQFPYVGTDEAGILYTGVVKVQVTSPTDSRFEDMASYSWAVPSVEFLAEYGITTGAGTAATFSPAGPMTRCDYVLMLCRAFGFTSTRTDSFPDVPADSYYATALAAAKENGIITADSSGAFHPTDPVTREDSMVFLYRALQAVDRSAPEAEASVLDRFPDRAEVSQSALPAVSAMVQAGVILGNGAGQLNPGGTLTRAEMAVILHRGLTL